MSDAVSSFLLKEMPRAEIGKRYRKDRECKGENTDKYGKTRAGSQVIFHKFFMKLNVVSGLEKV